MSDIQFGTDGWRAVIAESFTFDNVRRVANAIAVGARTMKAPAGIDRNALVVGFDRRFLSREFAMVVADTLRDSGYKVILSHAPAPSQTVSFAAARHKVLGGVIVTASHNPAKYNGLKVKGWYGGSALPEMYDAIARSIDRSDRREGGLIVEEDLLTDYIAAVRAQLDVRAILGARLAILHDPIHGVAAQLPSRVLGLDYVGNARIIRRTAEPITETVVDTIRGEHNPGFGTVNPEPIMDNLLASNNVMLTGEYDLAICNDGDADRLGILDDRGEFVSPQKIISLLALYLVRDKGLSGEIVKTFTTTRLIERIAKSLKATLHETAVGFKYVADLMRTRNVLIGGEESGGIAFGSFLPERDGVLAGLLVAECVAKKRKALSEIVANMDEEFGALYYDRRDVHRPIEQCARMIERARSGALDLAFGAVIAKEDKDGVKLNMSDGSWILLRRSGTEPMIRIYCESPDRERVFDMLERAVEELDKS